MKTIELDPSSTYEEALLTDSLDSGELIHSHQIEVYTMRFTKGDRVLVEPFDLEATVLTFLKGMSDEYNENHYVVEFDDFQSARYDEHRADWVHRAMVVREEHLSEPPSWKTVTTLKEEEVEAVKFVTVGLGYNDADYRIVETESTNDIFPYTHKLEVKESALDD